MRAETMKGEIKYNYIYLYDTNNISTRSKNMKKEIETDREYF